MLGSACARLVSLWGHRGLKVASPLLAIVVALVSQIADVRSETILYTLQSGNFQAFGEFGSSLAMGDIDGDGRADVAVGAPREAVSAIPGPQGRAYVFSGASGSLIHTLDTLNGQAYAHFGHRVAIGDVTGDGRGEIVVGAPNEDIGSNESQGRVYVFDGQTGAFLRQHTTPNPQPFASFGFPVVADLDGDGKAEIVIAAPNEDVGGNERQGRVYVFSGATGVLLRTMTSPSTDGNGLLFGAGMAIARVNADIFPDIIVGSPEASVSGELLQGRAYVFDGATGDLVYSFSNPSIQPIDSGIAPQFGFGIAAGDMNADGRAEIVISSNGHDAGASVDQGRVYVYAGATGLLMHVLDKPDPQSGACFGCPVAVGDLDGDGLSETIVGAFYEDTGGNSDEGRVYVFNGTDGSLAWTINAPYAQAVQFFGFALATGDTNADGRDELSVGSPLIGGPQGRVFVFDFPPVDTDGDGILDHLDSCPQLAGPPEHDGCPPPGPPIAVGGSVGLLVGESGSSAHASSAAPIAALASIGLLTALGALYLRRGFR